MKWVMAWVLTFSVLYPLEGPHLGFPERPDLRISYDITDSFPDLRSTNHVSHHLRRFISIFSFSEQYRPMLELVNTLFFNAIDEYEVTHFLDEMLPDAELLGALHNSSWWYLFSSAKLPVWIDVTLASIILTLTATKMLPALKKPDGSWIDLEQVNEAVFGYIGFLGVPLVLLGHSLYRLIKTDTIAQVSDYFMAAHMMSFFHSTPPNSVPCGLKSWFVFYAALNEEDLEKRIKRGLLINDLGVALCAISIGSLESK